jgi:hypothetical protein
MIHEVGGIAQVVEHLSSKLRPWVQLLGITHKEAFHPIPFPLVKEKQEQTGNISMFSFYLHFILPSFTAPQGTCYTHTHIPDVLFLVGI